MGRKSFNSTQNFLAATALNPKTPSRNLSLADQLIETRLRSEQAKLALLEAELPDESEIKYTRYVDMPPPTPEDEAEFDREFQKILSELFDEDEDGPEDEDHDAHDQGRVKGPRADQTVQDWFKARGATIPDLPEWQVPLYLDTFKFRSGECGDGHEEV